MKRLHTLVAIDRTAHRKKKASAIDGKSGLTMTDKCFLCLSLAEITIDDIAVYIKFSRLCPYTPFTSVQLKNVLNCC